MSEAPEGGARRGRRTQQERSEEARARLLAAAIELISRHGFAETTMARIAERAGFTRGAIQHHFAGRDELVLAIIQLVEDHITASFDAVPPAAGHDLGTRIDTLVTALGRIATSPDYLAVVDLWLNTRAHEPLAGEVRRSMIRSSASFKRLWFRVFADDVPMDIISDCRRIVVNLMRGIVVTQVLISNNAYTGRVLAAAKEMVRAHMLNAVARAASASADLARIKQDRS